MKNIYLLLVTLLLITKAGYSQEKFIEVVVSDTAWVKPNQFVYQISLIPSFPESIATDDDSTGASYTKKLVAYNIAQQSKIDSIKSIVSRKGFTIITYSSIEDYNTPAGLKGFEFEVFSSSADSVKMLYNMIKSDNSFTGYVRQRKSTNEGVYRNKLMQHIIEEATRRASTLASLSKMHTGGILAVKESPGAQQGWTAYPPLSSAGENSFSGWHTTSSQRRYVDFDYEHRNDEYQIEMTLTVRFAAQ